MFFSKPTAESELTDEEEKSKKEGLPQSEYIELSVTMTVTATPEQIISTATATQKWSEGESKGKAKYWNSRVKAGQVSTPYAGDMTAERAISFQVFPASKTSPADVVAKALKIAAIANVNTVWLEGDKASIGVLKAASISPIYTEIGAQNLLPKGVNYSTGDGRVRIVDRPGQLSAKAVHTIVSLAVTYPGADVALQSQMEGPSSPSLYLNHLTGDEARAISATLSTPSMASANRGDYIIPFAIRSNEPDDLNGTLGSVTP